MERKPAPCLRQAAVTGGLKTPFRSFPYNERRKRLNRATLGWHVAMRQPSRSPLWPGHHRRRLDTVKTKSKRLTFIFFLALGMCSDCGLKVVGEGTGCTAMDRVFRKSPPSCHDDSSLSNVYAIYWVPRYRLLHLPHLPLPTPREALLRRGGRAPLPGVLSGEISHRFGNRDGQCCECCYLGPRPQNSLEKCCVCTEPILDRILRATGKPYHPQCFTCVVCHICLDGIPFTVDAANRIHCIEDFHK